MGENLTHSTLYQARINFKIYTSTMYTYMYLLTGELYMHLCILTSIHKELTAELQVCFMMSTKTGVRLKDSCKDSLISLSAAGKYITYQ